MTLPKTMIEEELRSRLVQAEREHYQLTIEKAIQEKIAMEAPESEASDARERLLIILPKLQATEIALSVLQSRLTHEL